jgi:hypothetical protein
MRVQSVPYAERECGEYAHRLSDPHRALPP